MPNLFNGSTGQKIALALAAFGQDRDQFGEMLNYFNTKSKEGEADKKDAAAVNYLNKSGLMDAPTGGTAVQDAPPIPNQIFGGATSATNTNPVTRVGANMQAAPELSDQLFGNFTPQTDTSQIDLMKAVGPGNLLNSRLDTLAKAKEPLILADGAGAYDRSTGKPFAVNEKSVTPPSDIQLLDAYAAMPDTDPRKAALGAIIKTKTQGAERETWHTMTPDEVMKDGLPNGNYKKSSTGNVQSITTPQQERIPQGFRMAANGRDLEFIPGGPADPDMQSPAQKGQLGKLEADSGVLKKSLDYYKSAVKDASWDDFKSAAVGGLTKGGQRLKGAWTNSALMAKGQGLFELGVLSGPDMDVITGALKDPGSVSGQFSSKDAYIEGIDQVSKLIDTRLSEYRKNLGSPSQRGAAPAPANSTAGWSIVRVK